MGKSHELDFEPVFSSKALDTFLTLSKSRQLKVAKIVYQLARPPFRDPDYATADATGRHLSNVRIAGYLLTYWLDRSPKELRIVDLVEL